MGESREKDLNKNWLLNVEKIRTIINIAINSINESSILDESTQIRDKLKAIQITAIENEIQTALGKLQMFTQSIYFYLFFYFYFYFYFSIDQFTGNFMCFCTIMRVFLNVRFCVV